MWGYGLNQASSGYKQVVGASECGNDTLGSIKHGEFLDQLKTGYQCHAQLMSQFWLGKETAQNSGKAAQNVQTKLVLDVRAGQQWYSKR
jgi:hypothetical protein